MQETSRLDAFRARLREHLRDLGRTQKELARALGLHPNRLSHKLGGTDGAFLTRDEVKRVVETLASWGAITTQVEAAELFALAGLRRESVTPREWSEGALRDLMPAPPGAPPISSHAAASVSLPRPRPLPVPPTSFIGRERDVAAVRDLLGEAKLLTLTGTGGAGKTRLALQVAADVSDRFADGVAFVALAGVGDAGLVPAVIAETLELRRGTRDVPGLVAHLQDRQMLLMLDNFEHVLTAASLVERLLVACRHLKILVTSRVLLRLYGEYEYRVPPLDAWGESHAAPAPAVQLFLQRAKAARPGLVVSPQTIPVVQQICEALDGLPLAIELAAARVRVFPPEAILPRLSDRLGLLTGGARNLPERQQTLRGALDWSHALLGEDERILFRRLAVFSGFGEASVRAVCDTDADTLDRLLALADQSLLECDPDGVDVRFSMLQTVRDYAVARLAESGEAAAVHRRHAEYVLHLAEEAEPHLYGREQVAWRRRLDRELGNIRGAFRYLLNTAPNDALRLAIMLPGYWGRRGYQAEGKFWLDAALERTSPSGDTSSQRVRATALVADGAMTATLADFLRADHLLTEAMALYQLLNDQAGMATVLDARGELTFLQGDLERSREYRERALAIYRDVGDRWRIADVQRTLGTIALAQLDLERGTHPIRESTEIFTDLGDHWALAGLLSMRAAVALLHGDVDATFTLAGDAVRMGQEFGDNAHVAESLVALAVVLSTLGDESRAARVWGAAEAALQRMGLASPTSFLSFPALAPMRAVVEDSMYGPDIEAGHALSLDEGIDLALGVETGSLQQRPQ